MNRNIAKLYLISLVFLVLGACGKSERTQSFSGVTMGTAYTVKIADDTDISQQKIDDRLMQINQIFSTWDVESELSLLNKQPINQWISVSDELFYVLKASKEIEQETNGYFDSGIGRLIDVWGFGVKKITQKPIQKNIDRAFKNSSIRYLTLKDGQHKAIIKTRNIHINLSAIAKGYAVDAIATLLKTSNYLVEIGGEVRTHGTSHGKQWTIGIEQPNNTQPIAITLNDQAIATSGDYRNYSIWNGTRYHHILNPNTGRPANSNLASVSVIHPQTMIADAYATAMLAMGSHNAAILAKRLGLSVILILNQQHNFEVIKINH
ncbi:FAD:protein FMN transferase [Candidatus Thiodubiliella endoseptemdiera]|uniref:FAD:protein FMN transferase n=1 Tax=Candidatus Thiodubiliella endoseptemdiera TaxID=2738886 RepID=A0A853F287_9GAMM|nr:FAD:protein FMN transferase [Candidatus Thiodubiliella endoseptemdiera]